MFLHAHRQSRHIALPHMSTPPLLLELFAGSLTAGMAVWFVVLGRSTVPVAEDTGPPPPPPSPVVRPPAWG